MQRALADDQRVVVLVRHVADADRHAFAHRHAGQARVGERELGAGARVGVADAAQAEDPLALLVEHPDDRVVDAQLGLEPGEKGAQQRRHVDRFGQRLQAIYSVRTIDQILYVKADKELEYGRILDAMDKGTKVEEIREATRLLKKKGIEVLLMTGYPDIETAVSAIKRGAFDFVEKPFSDNALVDRIEQALQASADAIAVRQVRRDMHKMKAFVRFTPVIVLTAASDPATVV